MRLNLTSFGFVTARWLLDMTRLYALLMLAPPPPPSPGLSFSSEVLTCDAEPAIEDLREEQPRLHWQQLAATAMSHGAPPPPPSDDGEWAYEERREHGRE